MDLEDYESKQAKTPDGRRRRCMTCRLPEDVLAQVHQGRERKPKPVSFETISKWLADEHKAMVQPNTVRNHFVAGHHND